MSGILQSIKSLVSVSFFLQQFIRRLKSSNHVYDKVVHLCEHHKVNRQTGAPVLGCRVACQPGEGVVLL